MHKLKNMSPLFLCYFLFCLLSSSFNVCVGDAGNGSTVENLFTPKAFLIRYWKKQISNDLPKPWFLLNKASPLNAVETAAFTKLADQNGLSAHLPSFCSSAKLLCFPDLSPSLKKNDRNVHSTESAQRSQPSAAGVYKNYGPSTAGVYKNYGPAQRSQPSGVGVSKNYRPSATDVYKNYGPSAAAVYKNYGPSTAGVYKNYRPAQRSQPSAVGVYKNYGPSAAAVFKNYGPSAADVYKNYGPAQRSQASAAAVFKNYEPSTAAVFKNYEPSAAGVYKNYGSAQRSQSSVAGVFKNYGPAQQSQSSAAAVFKNYEPSAAAVYKNYGPTQRSQPSAASVYKNYGSTQRSQPSAAVVFKNYEPSIADVYKNYGSAQRSQPSAATVFKNYEPSPAAVYKNYGPAQRSQPSAAAVFKNYEPSAAAVYKNYGLAQRSQPNAAAVFKNYEPSAAGVYKNYRLAQRSQPNAAAVFKNYKPSPVAVYKNYGPVQQSQSSAAGVYRNSGAKKRDTFSQYTNQSSDKLTSMVDSGEAANRWVPGMFFREKMLKTGTVMSMPDIRDKMPQRSFLPRAISSKLPFSTSKLSELKRIFHASENSSMETILIEALSECERAPSRGETKQCVGSGEDLIDFAISVLGRNVVVRTTQSTGGSNHDIMIGSVKGINGGNVTKSVSCHQSLFPYLLYYCHTVPKVRVYEADLLDPKIKAKINRGVAICHMDTSAWSSDHAAFLALGSAPGKIEVCHWIFENDMIWTTAD